MTAHRGWKGARRPGFIIALALLLLLGATLAMTVGPSSLSLADVGHQLVANLHAVLSGESVAPSSAQTIVMGIRLPRLLLACIVGAALAIAGVIMQAVFQNPMADPYLLGTSSGAALGAVAAMSLGLGSAALGLAATPLMAFGGAIAVTATIYLLARRGGRVHTATLLLTGIAVGSLVSALTSLIMLMQNQDLHGVLSWLLGGLSGRSWPHVAMAAPQLVVAGVAAMFLARPLNLLLLGEETAANLGLNVQATRRWLLAAASLLAATAVAVSGTIGFVGLMIPHVVRLVTGPDHRVLLPVSALAGATLLVFADVAARSLLSPSELPVGIITALLGCPFFLYLLQRQGRRGM